MFTKLTKFPVHCSSKILTNYKQNAITSELHGANKIATNFDMEIKRIKTNTYMLVILLSSSMTLGYLMKQN